MAAMAKLGQLLVARGWITVQQLTRALKNQTVVGGRLGTCLLEMDVLGEDLLLKGLSEQLGVPAAAVEDLHGIPEEVRELLPARLARRCRAVPFRAVGGRLDVALLDARNLACQDEVAFATGKRVQVHVANEIRIFEALEKYYDEECPARFALLLDRLNRSRYLWDKDGAEGRHDERSIDPVEELRAAGDPFSAPAHRIEPPPLPEPSLPPSPRRLRVPLPPSLSIAPAAAPRPAAQPAIQSAPQAAQPAVQPAPQATAPQPEEAPPPPPRPREAAPAPAARPAPARPHSVPLTPQERASIGANTTRRPDSPPPAPALSLADLAAALEPVREPDQVGRALLAFLDARYARTALFQAGREHFTGWMAGQGIDPAALGAFRAGFDQPSVFLNLRQGSGIYQGPLPPMPAHRELARTWGGELPRECVLLPVRLKDRLVAVVYADTPRRPGGGLHLDELKRLADAAAGALGRCILHKKQAGTGT